MLRRVLNPVLAAAALLAFAGTAVATATLGRGDGAESFAAAFEARAVGDPSITSCPGLGPGGQKLAARYEGTFTIPAEQRRLAARFSVEILFDRETGLGTAEGSWRLAEPRGADAVAQGRLVATVTGDPPGEVSPPDADLELHGFVIGETTPSDSELPAQTLLGAFAASVGDGATFPHLKGTVGDPSVGDPSVGDPSVGDPSVGDPSVGDPSVGDPSHDSSLAVLVPSSPC